MAEDYSKNRYAKFSKQSAKAASGMKKDVKEAVNRLGAPAREVKKFTKEVISNASKATPRMSKNSKAVARLKKLQEMSKKKEAK